MNKACKVLAITGGVIAIFIAVIVMIAGTAFRAFLYRNDPSPEQEIIWMDENYDDGGFLEGNIFIPASIIIIIAGVMGIVGAAIIDWKPAMAMLFFRISSIAALLTLWAFLSSILFFLSRRFALANQKKSIQKPALTKNENKLSRRENMIAASRVVVQAGEITAALLAAITILLGLIIAVDNQKGAIKTDDLIFLNPDEIWVMDMHTVGVLITIGGVCAIAAAFAGAISEKKLEDSSKLSGILMLAGSFLSLFSIGGISTFALFLIGGIFALLKEKPHNEPALP